MYGKLKEGRYIQFPDNLPNPERGEARRLVVPTNNFYINQSAREGGKTFGAKQSTMVEMPAGHGAKAHRNFVWLPYVTGAVTMVPLAQADVLTGQMSGCWLIICQLRQPPYTKYACHIGTKEESEATHHINVAVKKAWKDYYDEGGIDIIGGFNPMRSLARIPKKKPDEVGKGFGLWAVMTPTNRFYNVFCFQQGTFWRIAHVGLVASTPPANLVTLA
jgi:hypothetical protein